MKHFICLLHVDAAALEGLSRHEHLALDESNRQFDQGLSDAGQLVASGAIAPARGTISIRRRDGALSVIDGPFAETREHLGGFLLLRARDRDEAVAILGKDPMADYATFEIREVKSIMDPDWREWADRTYGQA